VLGREDEGAQEEQRLQHDDHAAAPVPEPA
jgi:hypothetical protein